MMPRLVLSAFGVHSGGGMVLLRALLRAGSGRIATAFLDTRAVDALAGEVGGARVIAVAPTVAARMRILWRLSAATPPGDRLQCFNGLPPLRHTAARTATFVQARYFGSTARVEYLSRVAARIGPPAYAASLARAAFGQLTLIIEEYVASARKKMA